MNRFPETGRRPKSPARGLAVNLALAAALLAVAACARTSDRLVERYGGPAPSPSRFTVCYNHGCRTQTVVRLSAVEWAEIEAEFGPPAVDAAAERERVARAVARIERLVGARTGTAGDLGRNGAAPYWQGQLDCIDEAVNTTTYLHMMQAGGLLQWHQVGPPAHRGLSIGRWPHNTAVIQETVSGAAFAVDSWFFDNGLSPPIVPLEAWRQGWSPEA